MIVDSAEENHPEKEPHSDQFDQMKFLTDNNGLEDRQKYDKDEKLLPGNTIDTREDYMIEIHPMEEKDQARDEDKRHPQLEAFKTADTLSEIEAFEPADTLSAFEPADTLHESREGGAAFAGAKGFSGVSHGSDEEVVRFGC